MLVLTIRTDKPRAEISLYQDNRKLDYKAWEAHRQLSVTIHQKISDILGSNNLEFKEVEGIVCFKGPGSFTGLRIGLTVGNALAFGLSKPIVSMGGESWMEDGITQLRKGENEIVAMPEYGAEAHITQQRK